MAKTKDRILETALKLFNETGIAKVTLRTIASELNMSQGNLNYHYKKREDIVSALYFRLVEEIDQQMEQNKQEEPGLMVLANTFGVIMKGFYRYRFLMLDFVHVMREHEEIRSHYLEMSQKRTAEFGLLFQLLVENGSLREEILPNEYAHLYKRFEILGNFWMSSVETSNETLNPEDVTTYSTLIHQAIFPYLTEKGREEYQTIFSD